MATIAQRKSNRELTTQICVAFQVWKIQQQEKSKYWQISFLHLSRTILRSFINFPLLLNFWVFFISLVKFNLLLKAFNPLSADRAAAKVRWNENFFQDSTCQLDGQLGSWLITAPFSLHQLSANVTKSLHSFVKTTAMMAMITYVTM